jgi:membrane fusion protein (multidrug efflux system)
MLWIAGLALVGAGAIAAGINYWLDHRDIESTDNAYVKADSTLVAPKVNGYIRRLDAEDNRGVKAGQVLAQIDDRDYVVALDQAHAEVETRQAEVVNIEVQVAAHAAVIGQARAQLASAEAALELARSNHSRQQKMADIGFTSTQHAEESSTELRVKRADVERERAAVRSAEGQARVLQAQVEVARTQLLRANAVARRAQLDLEYTTIVAPVDGVIAARSVRLGQYVQAGTQLMALVPMQSVYVVANFKETQLKNVRGGERAMVRVDTFSDTELHGTVESLAPASGLEFSLLPPDNATGNFTKIVQRIPVKIRLDANQALAGRLRPGMSVEASIRTADVAVSQRSSNAAPALAAAVN